ncbi:alkaline-phosphatase-like protein, partial [Dimargaris cristalligena]
NGTHAFRKTVILLSFDGFRADYLGRGLTPHFNQISLQGGLQAEFLSPCFPSITFPNHYSIVTGLYPEAHGIVSNEFFDPTFNESFYYKNDTLNRQSRWWGGEPIWVTAERNGQLAGVDMWPGSLAPVKDTLPTYLLPYKSRVAPRTKIDQLISWLDQPLDQRPTFLASYVPEVDSAGHTYSPDSEQVNSALALADDAVGYLQDSLAARNLTNIVNVIYVSDHGMAPVPTSQVIYLDDLLDMEQVRFITGYPLAGITPHVDEDIPVLYETLKAKSEGQRWQVYLREDIPARFHYTDNERIPPIVCIPEVGWVFFTRQDYAHTHLGVGLTDRTIGVHGYDNLDPSMRAILMAHGPDFRYGSLTAATTAEIKYKPDLDDSTLSPVAPAFIHSAFSNIELYNLMCHLLDLPANSNNGTL